MNKRLKLLRKELGLTQTEFGEKIGLKQTVIGQIENGTRNLIDRNIFLICEKYDVNEIWLRTGDGEMFAETDTDEELAYLIGKLAADGDSFKKEFITAMLKLDDSQWDNVKNFIHKLAISK